MIKGRFGVFRTAGILATALVVVLASVSLFPKTAHASFYYSIPVQQDQITIHQDGSVQLIRYFEFEVESASSDSGTEIWAGLPTGSTEVTSVVDQDGNPVRYGTRSSGGDHVVTLSGFSIKPGDSKGFTVTATIPDFLHQDTRNEGYVTMQYTPGWWSAEVKVQDIAVILPGEVEKSEIRTGSRLWDGIAQTESGAYVVTWQFGDLRPEEKVTINVGIPDEYVDLPMPPKTDFPPNLKPTTPPYLPGPKLPGRGFDGTGIFGIFAVVIVGLIIVTAISEAQKEPYSSPTVRMEGVGVNETLSPVEASVLLRHPPEKTLTLMLFHLVKKGVIRVRSDKPLLVQVEYERDLSLDEKLFVDAVDRSTGEIRPGDLAACFKHIVTAVNEKLKPYCRRETEEFYRGLIARLWSELKSADSPELKLDAMDLNLLWLMQDELEMQEAWRELPQEGAGYGVPVWWRTGFLFHGMFPYYMWPFYLHGWYGGISGNLLGSQGQKFREITESVFVPASAPARSPRRSGGGSGGHHGGFAPPSCACACACVSCACACACAGGGGCT